MIYSELGYKLECIADREHICGRDGIEDIIREAAYTIGRYEYALKSISAFPEYEENRSNWREIVIENCWSARAALGIDHSDPIPCPPDMDSLRRPA